MRNCLKKCLAAVVAATLMLSLAACGGNTGNDTQTTGDAVDITLCLDWTPNTNHTGFYVALDKGYYEEAGLHVTIQQPPEDGAAALCASGKAQFAISAQDTLAAAWASEEPMEITTVAALVQHNTSGIISRAGEGMDTPAGLAGHTYSTWESPIELAMLKKLVTDDGGDWEQVNLIYNDITDEAAALAAKQTDAIWVFDGWGCISAGLQGLDYDYFDLADLDSTFDYYTPVLFANNTFLEENPETAKAFLAATAKGYQYAIDNPEESAQILIAGDSTGSLQGSEDLVVASQKFLSAEYMKDCDRWGYIDPARWNGFYNWLNDNDLVEVKLAENTGFTNDYLPE